MAAWVDKNITGDTRRDSRIAPSFSPLISFQRSGIDMALFLFRDSRSRDGKF